MPPDAVVIARARDDSEDVERQDSPPVDARRVYASGRLQRGRALRHGCSGRGSSPRDVGWRLRRARRQLGRADLLALRVGARGPAGSGRSGSRWRSSGRPTARGASSARFARLLLRAHRLPPTVVGDAASRSSTRAARRRRGQPRQLPRRAGAAVGCCRIDGAVRGQGAAGDLSGARHDPASGRATSMSNAAARPSADGPVDVALRRGVAVHLPRRHVHAGSWRDAVPPRRLPAPRSKRTPGPARSPCAARATCGRTARSGCAGGRCPSRSAGPWPAAEVVGDRVGCARRPRLDRRPSGEARVDRGLMHWTHPPRRGAASMKIRCEVMEA